MTIQIDRGIPMPAPARARQYPWKEMEVGDSFLMAGKPSQVANAVSRACRNYGKKFSYRKLREGVRVWRVA
jgi:hypothetical protein